jgi:hypothetical protein
VCGGARAADPPQRPDQPDVPDGARESARVRARRGGRRDPGSNTRPSPRPVQPADRRCRPRIRAKSTPLTRIVSLPPVPDGPGSVRYRAELRPFVCSLSRDRSVIGPNCQPFYWISRRFFDTATGIRSRPKASPRSRFSLQIGGSGVSDEPPSRGSRPPEFAVDCGASVAHDGATVDSPTRAVRRVVIDANVYIHPALIGKPGPRARLSRSRCR